jgi:hypothetical protein
LVPAFKQAKWILKYNSLGQTWVEYSTVTTLSVPRQIQRMRRLEKTEGIKMLASNEITI